MLTIDQGRPAACSQLHGSYGRVDIVGLKAGNYSFKGCCC